MHDNDVPSLDRDGRQTWEDWLSGFRRDAYPVFKRQGISFETALLLYAFNEMRNTVQNVMVRGDDEEDGWDH